MATKHRIGVILAAWAILGCVAIPTYAQPGRRGGGPGFGDRSPDDYLQQLLPKLRSGGLVLAHNINVRMADPAFMKAVTEDPQLETVVRGGMSISVKK